MDSSLRSSPFGRPLAIQNAVAFCRTGEFSSITPIESIKRGHKGPLLINVRWSESTAEDALHPVAGHFEVVWLVMRGKGSGTKR